MKNSVRSSLTLPVIFNVSIISKRTEVVFIQQIQQCDFLYSYRLQVKYLVAPSKIEMTLFCLHKLKDIFSFHYHAIQLHTHTMICKNQRSFASFITSNIDKDTEYCMHHVKYVRQTGGGTGPQTSD